MQRHSDADTQATLRGLVSEAAGHVAAGDTEAAAAGLAALLDVLQRGQEAGPLRARVRAERVAEFNSVVRAELLGSSAAEWLMRLLVRGDTCIADPTEALLDAVSPACPPVAAEEGDVNAHQVSICDDSRLLARLRLAHSRADTPDWSMSEGCEVWGAARTLAKLVLTDEVAVRDRYVLELGCGLGLAGLSSLHAGAARVVFSDRDEGVLRAVERSAELNGFSQVDTARVDWGRQQESGAALRRALRAGSDNLGVNRQAFDVAFAADIVYEKKHADQVSAFLCYLLCESLAREAVLVTGMPSKRDGVAAFCQHLGARTEALEKGGAISGSLRADPAATEAEPRAASMHLRWSLQAVPGSKADRRDPVSRFTPDADT